MTVFEGSRYLAATTRLVQDANGVTRPTLYAAQPFEQTSDLTFTFYLSKQGDHFDLLAQDTLRSPSFWWVLAGMNPEILDPFDIPAGTILRLPRTS